MRKEAELIKRINNHLKNPSGTYSPVFSDGELEIIKKTLIDRHVRESRITVGDVVTDNGYHQEVVITRIEKKRIFPGLLCC